MTEKNRYEWTDDLPASVQLVSLANALDGDGREIARATEFRDVDEWVRRTETPLGAATRFAAVVEHLDRLAGSGMDPVPVLERLATLAAVGGFGTDDAIRALDREQRLQTANGEGRGDRGRPSKVDPLVEATLSAVERMDHAEDSGSREGARRGLIEEFHTARPSRATFYRVRQGVLDADGTDISEIEGISETVV